MKKTFESFAQCQELREVIFLSTLPRHPHLIPTYDIFLDPFTRRLHIAMEYMDGNLYQLMKAREHKQFDSASVKSILCQILSGLEHIHEHEFFHRDIKPENILVSTSSPDSNYSFKRYSALMTPPSTPPLYTVKLADFGLARETSSDSPYTTYVSTRWYRAPEVLLRAGAYSAPVDIWALGAMAVEIATLKPLFPGSNEVDQVWRVCEIMGSPGVWVNKDNEKLGGGEWKQGVKLAQKLGFAFPKMAPQSIEAFLPPPQWPVEFSNFVTWCLMWDPAARPTSTDALAHEYFVGAADPLRPKSSTATRLLGRKPSIIISLDMADRSSSLSAMTSSWFRKSLNGKDALTAMPSIGNMHTDVQPPKVVRSQRSQGNMLEPPPSHKHDTPRKDTLAPITIPPPQKSTATTAHPANYVEVPQATSKKVGRQLSINSNGNHYAEYHRYEAEKALTGNGLISPTSGNKESFFSHLRKRARRFSAKNQANVDEYDADSGAAWASPEDNNGMPSPADEAHFAEIDRVLNHVRTSMDATNMISPTRPQPVATASNPTLRRKESTQLRDQAANMPATLPGPIQLSSRTRRPTKSDVHYNTPNKEAEVSDIAIASAHRATRRLDQAISTEKPLPKIPTIDTSASRTHTNVPYLTPSSSKEDYRIDFDRSNYAYSDTRSYNLSSPSAIPRKVGHKLSTMPATPPDDETEWAASVAAGILAAQAAFR